MRGSNREAENPVALPVGPIEEKTKEEIKPDTLGLPPGFEWKTLDINNNDVVRPLSNYTPIPPPPPPPRAPMLALSPQLEELYHLLHDNYVEDDENMFRFDYSREFLKWYAVEILSQRR